MTAPIVFFDIAAPDDGALRDFYAKVFGWSFDAMGQTSPPVLAPLRGAVRGDPAEKRIYLGVPDVTAALAHVAAAGGTVQVPRFEVPGVVVLGLFADPAGNPMGLVELENGAVKVP